MKYVDTLVSFSEIPNEISLCINVSNCPYHCPGCHSQYLWKDEGKDLTVNILDELVRQNPGISCVCLMGGKEKDVIDLIIGTQMFITSGLRLAWYTGQEEASEHRTLMALDYIKVGPYIERLGPLTSKTTNQRLYKIGHHYTQDQAYLTDITSEFWKDETVS